MTAARTVQAAPSVSANTQALLAVPNPIILPEFTVPGDETTRLILPARPEISHLPQAIANAARRFADQAPPIITFVNPATGAPDPSADPPPADPSWLLIDTDPDAPPPPAFARIQWNSASP